MCKKSILDWKTLLTPCKALYKSLRTTVSNLCALRYLYNWRNYCESDPRSREIPHDVCKPIGAKSHVYLWNMKGQKSPPLTLKANDDQKRRGRSSFLTSPLTSLSCLVLPREEWVTRTPDQEKRGGESLSTCLGGGKGRSGGEADQVTPESRWTDLLPKQNYKLLLWTLSVKNIFQTRIGR